MSTDEIGPVAPLADMTPFLSALVSLLPVLVIAGMIELRYLLRLLARRGIDLRTRPRTGFQFAAHAYVRLLAAAMFAAVLLTSSAVWAMHPNSSGLPSYWEPLLSPVLGITCILVALPALAAVINPGDLLQWYDDDSEVTGNATGANESGAAAAEPASPDRLPQQEQTSQPERASGATPPAGDSTSAAPSA